MKKVRDFKFTRNPAFIPAGLSDTQLTEIEQTCYDFIESCQEAGFFSQGAEKYGSSFHLGSEMRTDFLEFHGKTSWSDALNFESSVNGQAWTYAKNCVNFLIVCGSKAGLWYLRQAANNRSYAYAMGYYN